MQPDHESTSGAGAPNATAAHPAVAAADGAHPDGAADGAADGAPSHRAIVIGAGFAGLGAAIRLKQAGIEDFVVLEAGDGVGGTWRVNTYPGCLCDIPSHLYSFSFAPNPDWTRTYSCQPEIRAYLRRVSREHGVDAHIRLHTELTGARWDDDAQLWRVQTTSGPLTAQLLIAGSGPLSAPLLPDIAGIDDFRGTKMHSACWDHSHVLDGERVAVIGTGATAIQLVPHVQRRATKLHVFQRTAPWVTPHSDRATRPSERRLYRTLPLAQRLVRAFVYVSRELYAWTLMRPHEGSLPERIALRHLRAQVPDPRLRAKLTPRYRIGCKRTLISNDYYPALQCPNVELVTDPIASISPAGIVSADGTERELDTIIFATGFHVTDPPLSRLVRGRDGRTLDEHWQGSPQAYYGTTVAGFPNLFMLVGPNSGLGHNSIVYMIEAQLNYVLDCVRQLERGRCASIEVRGDAQRRFNDDVQRRLQGSTWESGGCASWYHDAAGRNTTIWPGSTWPFRHALRRMDPNDHELLPRAGSPAPGGPPSPQAPSAPAPDAPAPPSPEPVCT
jgi:cation diffusion facilitator CzcD-associated flavoprotein CzcO